MEPIPSLLALQTIFNPAVLVFMIPITAIVLGVGAKIIKSMQDHQISMAELMHRKREPDMAMIAEIQQLRLEMQELRDRVNQAALASDDFNRLNLSTPPSLPQEAQQRINEQGPS